MGSCKILDFRGRDVLTKIPNSFNLVSDNLALGLQLFGFSLFLYFCHTKGAGESVFPCLWIYYTYTCVHI